MYRREHRHQLSCEDFFLQFGGKLSGDNRSIKLAELIPWNELEDDYAAQCCKGFRSPAKARVHGSGGNSFGTSTPARPGVERTPHCLGSAPPAVGIAGGGQARPVTQV